ncbi:MAG: UDP-N-acetylmuramoyl-tripeptide--D-alanyl-D-alanine ligase [Clostridium sp.]|nr:UDP-N-acetylmuramoyl-tripeptide--D-alanyl-D-alanine ligase [Clostridium sp.]
MLKITFAEAAAACGGVLMGTGRMGAEHVEDEYISQICVDSRMVAPAALFIALKGERVDGHDYIAAAIARGAHCAISERDVPYCHIRVDSSLAAMQRLAAYLRRKSGIPVIAVVGSVGKTSTRQMLSCVLGKKYNILSTSGNFNNEYGLPQILFGLSPEHELAVLELGISNFGEMDRLGAIAAPDYAVYTNIGQMHLENLGNRDGVFKAKMELVKHMNPNGRLFLNGADDKLRGGSYPLPVTFFGMDESYAIYPSDIVQHGLLSTSFILHFNNTEPHCSVRVNMPAIGLHMVQNAVAAANAAVMLGLTPEQIAAGIESYSPVGRRGRIVSAGSFTIMDDCYNAGPDSMRASILALPKQGRRKALLGDMLELGEGSQQQHYELGRFCAEAGLDMLFVSGSEARFIARGAADAGMKQVFLLDAFSTADNAYDQAAAFILAKMQPDDVLLVKASRGMKFEKIIDSILEGIQ